MSRFGFNINRFIAELGAGGVAHQHRYEVVFGNTRSGRILFNRAGQEKLNVRLENVTLPGSVIGSTPINLQGIDREIPYGRIYDGDFKLVYLEDSKYSARKLFDDWQNRIIDDTTFQLNYYNDYVCDEVNIVMYTLDDRPAYEINLYDVFPKTINALELSGNSEEFVRTDVDLSFRRWKRVR